MGQKDLSNRHAPARVASGCRGRSSPPSKLSLIKKSMKINFQNFNTVNLRSMCLEGGVLVFVAKFYSPLTDSKI